MSGPRIRVGAVLRHGDAVLLLQQKKGDAVSQWVAKVEKEYKGKVSYATGYEPPDTTTTGTGTTSG